MFKLFIFSAAFLALLTSCSTSDKVVAPSEKSWELIWEDSFKKTTLDTTYWSVIKRGHSDWNNTMSDHPDCIILKDGKLYLRGIVNPNLEEDTSRYLTGGVETKGKFAFQYGKIEIHAKLENAQGAWPAMWMLGDQPKYGGWPKNGEIDIMEHLNFENQVYQTVHSYYTIELGQKTNPPYSNVSALETENYNTYGLEWFPDRLVFTLNGKETFTYPRLQDVDPSQWPFDQPFFVMIDMQLGGSWVGEVNPEDLPVQMIVDWVRVYREK